MIELKITGDSLKDFYENAAKAFILLAHGGNTVFAQPPAGPPTTEQQANRATAETAGAVAEENPKVLAEPKTRKPRATKAPVTIDNDATFIELKPGQDVATEFAKLRSGEKPAEVDEDPLGLNDVSASADIPPKYTVDDMRQRVKDILAAHGPKTKENPNARGNEMPACVAYVRKLFAPFGVKLAAEVPPDRFAEFMAASEPYLQGTAE